MPARGRRSAKPFTRRRSAAAFRLRPPVPRMNLFPEPRPGGRSGGEAGAARGCSAPAPSRRTAGLAGVGYGCPFGALRRAFRSPFRRHGLPTPFRRRPFIGVLLSAAFCRRPFSAARPGATVCRHLFADVLFSAARPFGAAPLFFVPDGTVRSAPPLSSLPPLVSAPSPLCPLSSLSPLRSVPSPLCPLSAPSPLRSVPFPSRSRPVPVPVPSFGGAPLRRFFSVRGLKNRKNCLDL